MSDRETIDKGEGRVLFGSDPAAYDSARPGHSDRVYDVLVERCGLGPGARVLEIGPGTGQATRRLLELGARPLVAIEPDPALAAYLIDALGDRVEVRLSALEDALLVSESFDLAVAASSFHWVDEQVGLGRISAALRPGGHVALWWTVFGDSSREDPFRAAVDPLMQELARSPSHPTQDGPPFASDGGTRVAALETAGFEDVTPSRLEWAYTWDTDGIRGLFGTFSPILALDPEGRETLLDAVAHIADTDFGGNVTRPVVTALYTARKPG